MKDDLCSGQEKKPGEHSSKEKDKKEETDCVVLVEHGVRTWKTGRGENAGGEKKGKGRGRASGRNENKWILNVCRERGKR